MSDTPKPQTSKKKKGSKKPALHVRMLAALKGVGAQLAEVGRGLRSPDRPTRKMSVFFFTSLAGVLAVSVLTVRHFARAPEGGGPAVAPHSSGEHGESRGGASGHGEGHGGGHDGKRHGDEHGPQLTMLELGTFSVELKPVPGAKRARSGGDLADISLVLECDGPDTHEYLEQRLPQARGQVTSALLMMEREELLSPSGKAVLKARILEQLNAWLPKGKVKAVYFSKLIVG